MMQPGTQIGRYEIQRRLGRGGMGTVYVAHDPVLGRMVAIKVFLSDLEMPDAAQRFAREARSAAALNHSNIVTIHDFGDWQSQPYIVMEYVQGETLAEIIRRKAPVPPAEKLRWMEELCAGAGYAHQIGVIHRDIKPTNLMVDRTGRLKILDFGIAKLLGTLGSNATALIGTPGYMAPEQILGGAIDHRSDLFAIAVVCYELLTYTEAFPGDSIPAITHRIINAEPVALGQQLRDAPAELSVIIERGLKKAAADRFPDADAFRQALAGVRRQLESGSSFEAAAGATLVGTPPGGGSAQRGTGSARRPVGEGVGVAELTPPPDPRRTDREQLARRRTEQIETSLAVAQQRFEEGELELALDACQQALLLDDNHQPALELEGTIKAALAKRQAVGLVSTAREELAKGALTAAQSLLEQARSLAETPEAKRLERDLKLARVEQERLRARVESVQKAVASARSALARGEAEVALRYAREAIDLDPESPDARAVEEEAMRVIDADVPSSGISKPIAPTPPVDKTILAPPRKTPPPAKAPSTKAPGTKRRPAIAGPTPGAAPAGLGAAVARVQAQIAGASTQQKLTAAGLVAGIVAIAAVAALLMRPAASLPTGTLVVDAVPWATVVSVQASDGTNRPLPNPAATPLSLTVPIGTYQVQVAGPGGEARTIAVDVLEGAVSAAPVERFEPLTPESYFEEYLAAPAATEEPPAAAPPAPDAPAAAPATPPSQPPSSAGVSS